MTNQQNKTKLHDLGNGERVKTTVAGVPVTMLRTFELVTRQSTQRRRFEFRTTDAGELTVTAFDATPALTAAELSKLDWAALSLRAFGLAAAPAATDCGRPVVTQRKESAARPGRKSKAERSPEMLQRVIELHVGHGIEAVRREFGVSTRTAYNYLAEAHERGGVGSG